MANEKPGGGLWLSNYNSKPANKSLKKIPESKTLTNTTKISSGWPMGYTLAQVDALLKKNKKT